MAKLTIDTGAAGNPATGDTLRTAMTKVNANFDEVYQLVGDGSTGLITTAITNGDLKLQANGTGAIEIDTLSVTNSTITSITTNSDITLTPNGTGNVVLGNFTFNADQTVGAAQDNYVFTYDHSTGTIGLESASGGSATFTFVGDDSTGTAVTEGETFKFAGTQNVTTAVSGDTLTITGPDLSAYSNKKEMPFSIIVGDGVTAFSVNAGDRVGVNTSGGAATVNLPGSPSTGDAIYFADAGGAFSTNNLTIGRNGNTIQGLSEDMTISTNNASTGLFYNGSTWRIY